MKGKKGRGGECRTAWKQQVVWLIRLPQTFHPSHLLPLTPEVCFNREQILMLSSWIFRFQLLFLHFQWRSIKTSNWWFWKENTRQVSFSGEIKPSQLWNWIHLRLCVFSGHFSWWSKYWTARETAQISFDDLSITFILHPWPHPFFFTICTLSILLLYSFSLECYLLNSRNVHHLQLQVRAWWRTHLLPALLHLLQSSG